jgi:hypothetical protein
LIEHDKPVDGDTVSERATVPENPFRPEMLMLVEAWAPARTVIEPLVAPIMKS